MNGAHRHIPEAFTDDMARRFMLAGLSASDRCLRCGIRIRFVPQRPNRAAYWQRDPSLAATWRVA